ncbi:hypothetical protein QFZ81_003000 [Paenibacillus sp. V4I9]|nr:hypothetical protein [Paenibacillus sp. V4I9]
MKGALYMKRIINNLLLVITLMIITIFPTQAFAHTTAQTGSETVKWMLDNYNHAGATNVLYYNSPTLDSTMVSDVTSAASRWSKVTFTESTGNYTGYVNQISDSNSDVAAEFWMFASDSSGHLYNWSININKYLTDQYTSPQRRGVITHEFGHAVGLNDIYNSIGVNMYAYMSGWTAYFPTSYDLIGADEADH